LVFKAMHPRLQREVCIKTLRPSLASDAGVLARFEREGLTMAQLKHPNIVNVLDVGRAPDGSSYIVMELLEGLSLKTIIGTEAPLEVPRAYRLVDQILAALGDAHSHGIIHRDLKPGNVQVSTMRDGGEVAKLLDFGIARAIDATQDLRLTAVGQLVGTPGYVAPEQLTADHDHRV